jgi:hypothetical protein
LEPQLLSNERKWGEAELGWRAGSSVGAGHPSAAHGVAAAPLLLSLRLSRSRVSRAATSLLSQRTCTCTCTCTCTHPRRSVLTTDRGGARVASRGECGCGVCTSSLTAAALARVKAAHSPACVTSRAHRAVLRRLLLLLLLPRSQPHSQHVVPAPRRMRVPVQQRGPRSCTSRRTRCSSGWCVPRPCCRCCWWWWLRPPRQPAFQTSGPGCCSCW